MIFFVVVDDAHHSMVGLRVLFMESGTRCDDDPFVDATVDGSRFLMLKGCDVAGMSKRWGQNWVK
jgi:hypothetical protein